MSKFVTYSHPSDSTMSFMGDGDHLPEWAINVKPFVAPVPHPTERLAYGAEKIPEKVRNAWDRMVALGVSIEDIETLLEAQSHYDECAANDRNAGN